MEINKDVLRQYLLYSSPIRYTNNLVLYPVHMENVLDFNLYKSSIILRKNSTFPIKKIIKMSYLDFLFYCYGNIELEKEFKIPMLSQYYVFAHNLLKLVFKDQEVQGNLKIGGFKINGEIITPEIFDDIRRIILIQNGVDFNIDEFLHYDTEQELLRAKENISKDNATIEDYVDSLCIALNISEQDVGQMPIRKFWRYIKRISKRENFTIQKNAESTGMVKFKEPAEYWMDSIEEDDKFKDVKTSTDLIKKQIG